MVDGPTESADLDQTEANRRVVTSLVEEVLIGRRFDRLPHYIDVELAQHNPRLDDGRAAMRAALQATSSGGPVIVYQRAHRVLAEGAFVLSVCEGTRAGEHSAFYDLYRLEDGKLVEHWDTIEAVAPRSEWMNDNGKF